MLQTLLSSRVEVISEPIPGVRDALLVEALQRELRTAHEFVHQGGKRALGQRLVALGELVRNAEGAERRLLELNADRLQHAAAQVTRVFHGESNRDERVLAGDLLNAVRYETEVPAIRALLRNQLTEHARRVAVSVQELLESEIARPVRALERFASGRNIALWVVGRDGVGLPVWNELHEAVFLRARVRFEGNSRNLTIADGPQAFAEAAARAWREAFVGLQGRVPAELDPQSPVYENGNALRNTLTEARSVLERLARRERPGERRE